MKAPLASDYDVLVDFNDVEDGGVVVRSEDVSTGIFIVVGHQLHASDGEGLHAKVMVTRVDSSGLIHLEVVDTPAP